MIKISRYLVVVLTMAMALFGCGGGGSSGGDTAAAPSSPSAPSVSYSITGKMVADGAALSGVTVTLTATGVSDTATTDASGNYTFTGLANGTYTITPSSATYTFDPVSNSVTVNGADVPEGSETSFDADLAAGEHDYTVGNNPRALDYDSSHNMWVVNDVSVTKISPIGEVLGTFVLGAAPLSLKGIVVDRSSNTVYVAAGTKVFKLSSNGSLTNTFNGFNQASDITMDYLGNIFVSNSGTNQVIKINSSGTVLASYNVGNTPDSLTVDASNNVYVCNYQGASVSKISSAGAVSTLDPSCNYPRDIAVDSHGNLFVTSNDDGVVAIMDNTGLLLNTYAIADASYVAFDSNGYMFVGCHKASNGAGSVVKYSPISAVGTGGTLQHTYSLGSGYNTGMQFRIDSSDNLWVANAATANTVTEIVF